MSAYRTLDRADLTGKRVLLRAGFDVPMEHGRVHDTSRIEALVPTMRHILEQGASLAILAHQGRPKGKRAPEFSQKPLVPVLEKLLKTTVKFADTCTGPDTENMAKSLKPGEVLLLENLRFDPGEEGNDRAFAEALARLGDLYVNDAFTNCHRAHASMALLPKLLPSYMGLQLQEEVEHLEKALENPRRPLVLIIGGAKMETKVPVVERFLEAGDDILLGGAIANTFVAARGFDVGQSKHEPAFFEKAQELMLEADKEEKADIHVPRDAVVATEPSQAAEALDLPLEDIEGDMCMFDIGRVSAERYAELILKAGMIVWNGPLGMYEIDRFSRGTKAVADAVRKATREHGAISVIGGGDTIDFHKRYDCPLDDYTFVSVGGGAMLEFISGKKFPALEALKE